MSSYYESRGRDEEDLPVTWVVEPFNRSYAPGAKEYDFDLNQITITPEREEAVDFSDGYFDNAQGVLALKDSADVFCAIFTPL